MVDTTATSSASKSRKSASAAPSVAPEGGTTAGTAASPAAKERFSKAVEEAKGAAQAARDEAYTRAGEYREKLVGAGGQARDRATELAQEGKAKTTDALKGLSRIVSDNAPAIDEKLGLKYGDYARSAAKSIDDAASKLEAKDLAELGEDAKEFVRKSPGLAVGMAAVAGFMLARLFKGSDD